jgi:hypothetical protein
MQIVTLAAVLLVLTTVAILIYSKFKEESFTREQYAFKCLAAILSLVTLAVAAISSHEGLADQIVSLISGAMGLPKTEPPPAPLSEKMLIVLLVTFAVYVIHRSHENWAGRVSAEEVERTRMKRSTSLVQQAFDEAGRIAARKPLRAHYTEAQRVDPVAVPSEPNLVWHDHVRELFELWMPHATFSQSDSIWNPQERCWTGRDRSLNRPLFLFCVTEIPSKDVAETYIRYARNTGSGPKNSIFVVFKEKNGISYDESINFRIGSATILSEEFLYSSIVDFSDYFAEITSRVEKESFPGTRVVLKDVYTSSAASADTSGGNLVTSDLGQYLSQWAGQPVGKQIALLGEYGQGKSTAALMFAYESIRSNQATSAHRVPILLELRGKSPANLSAHELLAAWGQQYKYQASALMKLLIDGRLILILEGFDEMSNVSSAEARIAHFRSLWRFAYPKSKIIFTGRRNLFFEDRELQVVLRGSNDAPAQPFCETLHMQPFDLAKITNSLRWAGQQTANEILDSAKSNTQIFDIVSRPSLLFIVASLWNELRVLLMQGKITSALVIDRFIIHSYARQQEKEQDLNFMSLTTTERRYFNEGLAAYMAARDATNQITNADLRAAIERLYNSYPDGINILNQVVLETERPPLKRRITDREVAMETIVTDVRTHGILVNDVGQRDAFRFAHKSFYELLAAKVHAHSLLKIDPLFYDTISAAMDGDIRHAERRPETLKFFSEILATHVKPAHSPDDLESRLYDLLFGLNGKRSIVRVWSRALQLVILRFFHNSRLRNTLFAILNVVTILYMIWSSETVSLLMERSELLSPYRSAIRTTKGEMTLASIGLLISMILCAAFANVWSASLVRRSTLWAAVLLATDNSTRTNNGERTITKYLGKIASRDLIRKVRKQYNL